MQNNLPVQALSGAIHVYPTLSESVKRVADNYYREKLFNGRNRKLFEAYFKVKRHLPTLRRELR